MATVRFSRDDVNFWLDIENYVLEHKWDARCGVPCGPRRHLDSGWRAEMLAELENYPRNSIEQYSAFVLQGFGDEWFQEDDQTSIVYRSHVPDSCAPLNGCSEPPTYLRRFGEAGSGALPERGEAPGSVHYTGGGSPVRKSAKRGPGSPATTSFGWESDCDGGGPSLAT